VRLSRVIESESTPVRSFTGTCLPIRKSKVASAQSGIVTRRAISYGIPVSKGDLLVQLNSTRQKAKTQALKAEAEAERYRWLELKNGEREELIAEARSNLSRATVQLRDAKKRLQRYQGLVEEEATSKDLYQEVLTKFQVAKAEFDHASARFKLIQTGPRSEKIASAHADYLASVARYQESNQTLEEMSVRAPFDGSIGETLVEVGDWLGQGAPVAELFDSSAIDVVILIPESLANEVIPGQKAICRFPALNPFTVEAQVVTIGPSATEAGRSIPMVLRFINTEGKVKPGMSVEVDLSLGQGSSTLLVDKDAILRKPGQPSRVYVHKNGKALIREVILGDEVGNQVKILQGLSADEEVIIRGNERLRPGMDILVEQGKRQ
jgi:multidrug efflux pump subunit AcrA (membrane-fusion protein)